MAGSNSNTKCPLVVWMSLFKLQHKLWTSGYSFQPACPCILCPLCFLVSCALCLWALGVHGKSPQLERTEQSWDWSRTNSNCCSSVALHFQIILLLAANLPRSSCRPPQFWFRFIKYTFCCCYYCFYCAMSWKKKQNSLANLRSLLTFTILGLHSLFSAIVETIGNKIYLCKHFTCSIKVVSTERYRPNYSTHRDVTPWFHFKGCSLGFSPAYIPLIEGNQLVKLLLAKCYLTIT